MIVSAFRLVDEKDAADAALAQITANDNRRRVAGTEWKDKIDRARQARQRQDFAASEQLLEESLTAADCALGAANGPAALQENRERKATTAMALAAFRLERFEFVDAARLYKDAIGTFPDTAPDERWPFARAGGAALRRIASLIGSVEAAGLSVGILREAAALSPGEADRQDELGRACVVLGELTGSSEPFDEARAAYDAALSAASKLPRKQADAVRYRVQINQAVVLRHLGKIHEDSRAGLHAEAEALLRQIIGSLSNQSAPMARIDLPRAWDNLGTLLFDQGNWNEAIAAFEMARDAWADPEERARTLGNLGLTYGSVGRFEDALQTLDEAHLAQPVAKRPLAWSRTQHYRGEVLRLSAPKQGRESLERALEILAKAREHRPRDRAPTLWAETTAAMGMVFHDLGQLDLAVESYLSALPIIQQPRRGYIASIVSSLFANASCVMLYCHLASRKGLLLNTYLSLNEPDKIAALAELIAPLGRSETEAAPLLSQALQRLGWSSRVIRGQSDDQALPAEVVKQPPLPEAASRLKWEQDRLPYENPAAFAWRAYEAEAKAGSLHRGVIGQEDKPLAVKLASWLRAHPMPDGIDIPTKPEWITRQAEAGRARPAPAPRTEGQRLYDALHSRRRRARHHLPSNK